MTRTVKTTETYQATRRADLVWRLRPALALALAVPSLNSSTRAISITTTNTQTSPYQLHAYAHNIYASFSTRELLPAGPTAASSASSERETTPQSATGTTSSAPRRRPQTKIACTSCRRRKSKCDGQRPVCSLCAGMGRTRCEYDAGPDVTRFAALKTKHEELQRRLSLFEELFRLLSMRSEPESVEIIRRMRTLNIETDLDDLVKFIKNADLLIQLASAQAEPPASGTPTNLQDPPAEDISSLLELLNSAISKLDATARLAFLDTIRLQIEAFITTERSQSGPVESVKMEGLVDGEMDGAVNGELQDGVDGVHHHESGVPLKRLLNDDTTKPR
ncbi:uncharacterized protein CLUP02_08844 [Colletotrichum lupini]|uniref:Zn(2)-C6 fungal-type domain-containing protein n=1 Tax=Colletotrichum lupini TaxID=145971 RepID=A0A9Q8WH92_9PEZI|nr:uncharacterized protein CLUP02_08844 [Colletotrichum lupini]UQC83349.1 hypothetical protein CLUP02_08844 [Colletotrichum lupini]